MKSKDARRRVISPAWTVIFGFILGGLLSKLCETFLTPSPARDFLTTAVSASFGPLSIDLYIVSFTLGPITFFVNVLTLVGVLSVALIVRSLL